MVEIAVVQVTPDGEVYDEWSSLVNPGCAVGPTRVHGITDADVRRAPKFSEVLGEVNARMAGRALVAHNATFDLAFLELEYARAGWAFPCAPRLCTLEASHQYLPSLSRRRLEACCSSIGVPLLDAHSALSDARAAAALLRYYLNQGDDRFALSGYFQLPTLASSVAWPDIPRGPGLGLPRGPKALCDATPAPQGTLARLLACLPSESQTPLCAPEASGYIELLAEVLDDHVLTEDEAAALLEFATRYSLNRSQTDAAHRSFLFSLAQRVVEDGKVTRDERRELLAMATLLGLTEAVVKKVLSGARASLTARLGSECRPLPNGWDFGEPLRVGDGVAFTGCDELERARLEGAAQAGGLRITGSVSGKTAILVTDDSDSGTTKARRAIELGTRIVTPDVFSRMLDYVQPAAC